MRRFACCAVLLGVACSEDVRSEGGTSGEGGTNIGGQMASSTVTSGSGGTTLFPPTHVWSRSIQGTGFERIESVVIDGTGNVIVAGQFDGELEFGDGSSFSSIGQHDIFLLKLSAMGDTVWVKRFATNESGSAVPRGVAIDANEDIIVVGGFAGSIDFGGGALATEDNGDANVFAVKLAPDGGHLWSRSFGDMSQEIFTDVAVTSSGEIVVCGFFTLSADFGGGTLAPSAFQSWVIAKYAPDGEHMWSQAYGIAGSHSADRVAVDATDHIVVMGTVRGSADFGGGPLGGNVTIVKLDTAGQYVWSRGWGRAVEAQLGSGLGIDKNDAIRVAGFFEASVDFGGGVLTSAGDEDVFMVAVGSSGDHQWSQRFGTAGRFQRAYDLTVDGADNVIVVGEFSDSIDFGGGNLASAGANDLAGEDVFVASFDATGAHGWSARFGDSEFQAASRVAADAEGNVVMGGIYQGQIDFGGGPLVSSGDSDLFVVKIAPP